MGQRPKCSFWNYREMVLHDVHGKNCDKPAFMYRFHGKPGNLNRMGLYCAEHTYRNTACREITDEILEQARAEGWPFMEWPPPVPEDPVEVLRELGEAGLSVVTDRQPELKRVLARYLRWRDQQKDSPCPQPPSTPEHTPPQGDQGQEA